MQQMGFVRTSLGCGLAFLAAGLMIVSSAAIRPDRVDAAQSDPDGFEVELGDVEALAGLPSRERVLSGRTPPADAVSGTPDFHTPEWRTPPATPVGGCPNFIGGYGCGTGPDSGDGGTTDSGPGATTDRPTDDGGAAVAPATPGEGPNTTNDCMPCTWPQPPPPMPESPLAEAVEAGEDIGSSTAPPPTIHINEGPPAPDGAQEPSTEPST